MAVAVQRTPRETNHPVLLRSEIKPNRGWITDEVRFRTIMSRPI